MPRPMPYTILLFTNYRAVH